MLGKEEENVKFNFIYKGCTIVDTRAIVTHKNSLPLICTSNFIEIPQDIKGLFDTRDWEERRGERKFL